MTIGWADINAGDESISRRLLAVARSIAPGVDALEGEAMQDALAILKGVLAEAGGRGSRFVQSQRIGPASVSYTAIKSWFSDDDRTALRALVGVSRPGLPLGNFPAPSKTISRMWPEDGS